MHPIIFQTKFFILHTLWIFVAIAIILGTYAVIRLSIKNGLKLQFLSEHVWQIIFSAIVGARVLAIAENYKIYFAEFSTDTFLRFFYIWDKGLNAIGAIIGLLIYFSLLCRKKEQDFFKWLDVLIPSVIVALAVSHLGAFFDGINYGNETSLPWGVNFESPSIKYAVPIHPTQIYAFLYSAAIAIALILLGQTQRIKNMARTGFIGVLGIMSYSFFSFLESFVRGDDTLMLWDIRIPQIMALLIFMAGGIFFYRKFFSKRA